MKEFINTFDFHNENVEELYEYDTSGANCKESNNLYANQKIEENECGDCGDMHFLTENDIIKTLHREMIKSVKDEKNQ